MELAFKLARPDHADAILAMRIASSADLQARFGPGPWGSGGTREKILRSIANANTGSANHGAIYVALNGDLCLGSVGLATRQEDFWPEDCWQEPGAPSLNVFGLCVHPSHQRKGVGAFIMESSASLARTLGLHWMRLDTYAQNAISTAFYSKLGYSLRATVTLNGNTLNIYETGI